MRGSKSDHYRAGWFIRSRIRFTHTDTTTRLLLRRQRTASNFERLADRPLLPPWVSSLYLSLPPSIYHSTVCPPSTSIIRICFLRPLINQSINQLITQYPFIQLITTTTQPQVVSPASQFSFIRPSTYVNSVLGADMETWRRVVVDIQSRNSSLNGSLRQKNTKRIFTGRELAAVVH